jgi:hypothetical protein
MPAVEIRAYNLKPGARVLHLDDAGVVSLRRT